ncbi:RES family NAD+ phosphorylase [Arthrobacter sp. zg-Y916]|uniref:RES family NAD+ phosphorylase n=1 Tax=Arthrobacter sp. zg-Y916 TaxID=2894190 RepID=UPI002F424394|nr:RES family NAD+ phosphorylase [Arthrobacter sp. zg-Y916]
MTKTPDPPDEFSPLTVPLPAGTRLFRCHGAAFRAGEANPGPRGAGRFNFFGTPAVPVLYFAQTPETALCETLLRYTPAGSPTRLPAAAYRGRIISEVAVERELTFALFHSEGLRRFGLQANQLIDTPPANYPQTRKWAAAAHAGGLDGALWMSHHLNGNQAAVVFGDRASEQDLSTVSQLALDSPAGFSWLVDACAPMDVDVLPPF